MNQTASICDALIKGKKLSIMNGFRMFNCTNIPREIGRSIERKFKVKVDREFKQFKSSYGHSGVYCVYSLSLSEENRPGIKLMVDYVHAQSKIKSEGVITKTLFE